LGDTENLSYLPLLQTMTLEKFMSHQCSHCGYDGFHSDLAWNYQWYSPFHIGYVEKYIKMTYVICFMTYVMTGSASPKSDSERKFDSFLLDLS
jgi:hypothetical protein